MVRFSVEKRPEQKAKVVKVREMLAKEVKEERS